MSKFRLVGEEDEITHSIEKIIDADSILSKDISKASFGTTVAYGLPVHWGRLYVPPYELVCHEVLD